MKKIRIGLSGKKGSFSEEASHYYCQKENITNYQLVYLTTVKNVLKSLNQNKIDWGIFPIENSNGGIVYEAVEAMSQYNFQIKKFFEIDISHCLIALPQTLPQKISAIVSHPQALKQCRMYLKRKWPDIELKEWEDTAAAAEALSQKKISPNYAVIASRNAAQLYHLDILEENIQDLKFNFTTFLAVTKRK